MVGSILKITTKHTALIDKEEIHPVKQLQRALLKGTMNKRLLKDV